MFISTHGNDVAAVGDEPALAVSTPSRVLTAGSFNLKRTKHGLARSTTQAVPSQWSRHRLVPEARPRPKGWVLREDPRLHRLLHARVLHGCLPGCRRSSVLQL